MLCEFSLPSQPEKKIRLKEATVSDAIDFSGIDPDCEEQATTVFLERVQERDTYSDPRLWTGEDRRFALFTYFVHTARDRSVPLKYTCGICDEEHTVDIKLARIMDTYTPIQGKAFREFVHYGHNVIVHPMLGRDLELLETYRYDLRLTEEKLENDGLTASELRQLTEEVRMKRVRMGLFRIMCCIDLPFLDANATPESRRPQVEEYIKQLPAGVFGEFFQNVQEKLREMRHGLKSALIDGRIYLQIPDVRCENVPDAPGVVLHYPFRPFSIIPTL
ncbi:hypothetical protein [Desulfovibrio piger]|uniref:hypothetical protein n=1 Tax=Desulfovibrio piger TaxID=901 RepID=UPI0026EC6E00|nr:hypothetical protein [Desulfovibrio piger]